MIKYILLSLTIFWPIFSYAEPYVEESLKINIKEDFIKNNVKCGEENPRTLNLQLGIVKYLLYMPELLETNIVNAGVVCRNLLKRWKDKRDYSQKLEKFTLYPTQVKGISEDIYRFSFSPLYDFCFEQGLCGRNILDRLNSDSKLYNCQTKIDKDLLITKLALHLKRPSLKPIPKVVIEHHPRTSYISKLLNITTKTKQPLFVSTMNLGGVTTREIAHKTKGTNKPTFIVADASLVLSQNVTTDTLSQFVNNKNLKLIPITTGVNHSLSFHWKLLFDLNNKSSVFTSLNLSTPGNLPYLDLIYNFNDQQVTAELNTRLLSRIKQQCKRRADISCLADFVSDDSSNTDKWNQLISDSCETFKKLHVRIPKLPPKKYFLAVGEDDVEYYINDLISKAKKDIYIVVHKLNIESIYKSLSEAKKRGVNVRVFVDNLTPFKEADFIHRFYNNPTQKAPSPHLKVMLIDGKTLFFGSGNFTHAGLYYSDELFAKTEDKQAIKYIQNIINIYLKVLKLPLIRTGTDNTFAGEPYLFIPNGYKDISNIDKHLKQYTKPLEGQLLKNYRSFTNEGKTKLKKCGLDHLMYVEVDDYLDCVKEEIND